MKAGKLADNSAGAGNEADARGKRGIYLASVPMHEAGAETAKPAKKSFFSDSAQNDVSSLLNIGSREIKRVDLRDIQSISKDEEEKIVNSIKEKLYRQSAGVTIAKQAHALTHVSEEIYQAAEQLFDFGADGVTLDQVLDFRFSSSVYQPKLNLPGVNQQYFEFYYKISQLQDISQYKKTSTSRADRPDILKTRILGIDANADRVKVKEQEILLILNKFAPYQLSQILSALKTLFCELSEYSREERASLFKALFSYLYDKACLEHAFIGLYTRVMWSVTFENGAGGAFGGSDLDIAAIYGEFRSNYLLKEITIGKTFLSQYQHSDLDSALASLYKQNNYKLHFEGCVLFSAQLFALDSRLLGAADLLSALFTALCRDLRDNDADQTVQNRIKELAKQTSQNGVSDAARDLSTLMLAKTIKARFSNVSLVVQALAICATALAADGPSSIEACLKKQALILYIAGLNQTNTDSLVLFKIRYLPSLERAPAGDASYGEQPYKDQRGGRAGRAFIKGDPAATRGGAKTVKNGEFPLTIRKWDTVTKYWAQNGLLDTVCAIYRVAVEQLSAQIVKNAAPGEKMHFLDVFVAECFNHGYEKLLFKQKFELLHALDAGAQSYAYDLLVQHFIAKFGQLDSEAKTQYVGMIIDLCLQKQGMIYQCLQKVVDAAGGAVASQFLVLFHHQVIAKAYSEVVDEYEDLFEEEEIDKFTQMLVANDFCAHYEAFPGLFDQLKKANYSYFSQADFLAAKENQAFATTPFEDLAIYKFHRIYVGPERISATQREALLKQMGVLQRLSSSQAPIDELLYRIFVDSNFELGYLALDVFPYSHVQHPRARFYIQRRVVEEILKGYGCPRAADFAYYKPLLQGAIAQVLFSAAYNAVKAGEDQKERFAAFVRGIKDLNCVNAQAAKQLLEKHRKSGDGYGVYQVYW